MAKRTVDDLLEAIETIVIVKQAVEKQERTIALILDRLATIEHRLHKLESGGTT